MGEILILGIIISIIFYEMTDITPGGIIVPGIMVLYINQIDRIIYTFIISLVTYFIVTLLSKHIIVFGKRKFALMIIISLLINLLFGYGVKIFTINMLDFAIIGYIVPGLIANEMSKQGPLKTALGLTIVVSLLQLVLFVFVI